jgi:hypothetical protein
MASLGGSLVRSGAAAGFEVVEDDGGLILIMTRAVDGRTARVTMTGTTEAFLLTVDDVYTTAATAYDDESKWEALRDFFECAVAFMERDYYEEIGERKGRVVHRVLHLTVPGGSRSLAASGGWRGSIGRMLGYRKSIVRPVAQ